jgi:hypothetical protein
MPVIKAATPSSSPNAQPLMMPTIFVARIDRPQKNIPPS